MKKNRWIGKKVLITAGPTREYMDPIRFLTNGSTGLIGFALAETLCELGASVTVISGPVQLKPDAGIELIPVVTAQEMHRAVLSRVSRVDAFISAAAVGDWRFAKVGAGKIKRKGGPLTVKLIPNPDILADAARRADAFRCRPGRRPVLVGFALETDDWIGNARKKLARKKIDLIVANRPESMGLRRAHLAILDRLGNVEKFSPMDKRRAARVIVRRIENFFRSEPDI